MPYDLTSELEISFEMVQLGQDPCDSLALVATRSLLAQGCGNSRILWSVSAFLAQCAYTVGTVGEVKSGDSARG